MQIKWTKEAWDGYLYWEDQDKKTLNRINELIKSIQRDEEPIGKPELLKHKGPGVASVRIDDKNRLVYRLEDDGLVILSCRGHYDDK